MFPPNALSGITVLDLTRLLPGPMATQWLVDMGARVIKIEDRGPGDYMRTLNPQLFASVNRGKEFLSLDLKQEADRETFRQLASQADVLVEGFRPGVMDRLGFGWDALHALNPRLVYVAITGYGYNTPYRDMAGHDINYLSLAGILDQFAPSGGPPVIPGIQIADLAGGSMYAVMGLLAALNARHRTGEGAFIDASMTHGSALLLPVARTNGEAMLTGRYACYNIYQAKDGRYVAVGALEAKFWANLCTALERADLIPDQFAEDPRRQEVIAELRTIFLQREAEAWFQFFRHIDACVTPVRTVTEAGDDWN